MDKEKKEWNPTERDRAVIDKYLAERKAKEERQREAEIQAEEILEQKGFKKIFRFTSVWFLRAHFILYDYYAEKDGRWFIKITTGKKKKMEYDVYSGRFRKYRLGNLHKHNGGKWEFEEIKE